MGKKNSSLTVKPVKVKIPDGAEGFVMVFGVPDYSLLQLIETKTIRYEVVDGKTTDKVVEGTEDLPKFENIVEYYEDDIRTFFEKIVRTDHADNEKSVEEWMEYLLQPGNQIMFTNVKMMLYDEIDKIFRRPSAR